MAKTKKMTTMVYVLDKEGKPLMPTERNGHVRKLLDSGRAVIVSPAPFTIRLAYDTPGGIQPVRLGVDCGTAHVGLSACTEKKELYQAEVQLRTDIPKRLSDRRMYRRARRGRKRYRKPRFSNRVASKKKGWLAPSVRRKVESHLTLIGKVHEILPITETTLEVGNFDIQRIKNPEIEGVGYQQGDQMGFWNVREYVLSRDGHECQCCHGRSGDKVLNVHHIESRKTGGNSPDNLVTLCETCHKAYHAGKIKLNLRRGFRSLRDAAVMNGFKDAIYQEARKLWSNVSRTWGYITKSRRIEHGIPKGHCADARVISGFPLAQPLEVGLKCIQKRRHNRSLYKAKILKGGRLKRNIANHVVNGFRRGDVVSYQGQECYISGSSHGRFVIKDVNGNNLVKSTVSGRKLEFRHGSGGYVILNNNNNNPQCCPSTPQ